ncbi:MAG: TIGR02186 family protein [Alphaproteobacteria bacterium]
MLVRALALAPVRRSLAAAGLALALAVATHAGGARADYLVADLSERRIDITTGFAGARVLLFGATDTGGDVVVVVRGPDQPVIVRRKERIVGLWVNRDWMLFDNVPAFYYVASSRPLDEIASTSTLAQIRAGLDYIPMAEAGGTAGQVSSGFRAALVESRQAEGLYGTASGQVIFLAGRLFRTEVSFPSNVTTGAYTVEVFLIRNGQVESAQRWPLFITKVGVSAGIYDQAHKHALRYGLVAVLIATVAGWLGALGFRRT